MPELATPLSVVGDMVAMLGHRHGLVSRVYVDSGEQPADAEAFHEEFRRHWDEAAFALQRAYGASADPIRSLAIMNPEKLTAPPPPGTVESDRLSVGVWRHADLWVFAVGREYRKGLACRYLVILGIAREGKEMAAVKLA